MIYEEWYVRYGALRFPNEGCSVSATSLQNKQTILTTYADNENVADMVYMKK